MSEVVMFIKPAPTREQIQTIASSMGIPFTSEDQPADIPEWAKEYLNNITEGFLFEVVEEEMPLLRALSEALAMAFSLGVVAEAGGFDTDFRSVSIRGENEK